jgi:hypothetical protein
MPSSVTHPIRLTVIVDEARRCVDAIPHATCRAGAARHWNVSRDKTVPEESVNWLFCWGKTGMGSRNAAAEARRVFNDILSETFSSYDRRVAHEDARANRYTGGDHRA